MSRATSPYEESALTPVIKMVRIVVDSVITRVEEQLQQGAEKLGKMHLSGGELPPPAVVCPVAGGGAVHDDQGVPRLGHHGSRLSQQSHLVVGVVGPGVGHVVQDVAALEAVPVRHRQEPLWSEGALGVNVEAFALRPSVVYGQLTGDGQGVTKLRLSGPERQVISKCECDCAVYK